MGHQRVKSRAPGQTLLCQPSHKRTASSSSRSRTSRTTHRRLASPRRPANPTTICGFAPRHPRRVKANSLAAGPGSAIYLSMPGLCSGAFDVTPFLHLRHQSWVCAYMRQQFPVPIIIFFIPVPGTSPHGILRLFLVYLNARLQLLFY